MHESRYTMRRLHLSIALLATLIATAAGLVAAPAMAYDVSAVYRDCETNGRLTGSYSRADLQAALSNIPSQMAEYSSCQAIIQHALLLASKPGSGHGGGGPTTAVVAGASSGGSGPGSPHRKRHADSRRERSKKTSPRATARNALTVSGSDIRPGSMASTTRSLPPALLVVLILLGLTAVTGGALAIRRRVVTRQST